jgi:zinc protease
MYKPKRHTTSLPGPDDTLRQELPNGITLLVRENALSPTVVVNGYLEIGAEDEPRDKAGLAGFVTDVMERGTQRRAFSDLYEEVESIAASFGLSASTHITTFGAKGLAEYLPLLLDILDDVLRNPAFRAEQVERARAEILTSIQEREHSTRRTAALTFHELAYPPAHPYHRSLLGYSDTIARITRDDLVDFHARYTAPQGMVIVVVGAVKAADVVEAITATFGDWQATRPARRELPPVPPLAERREKRIALPDKTQSDLVLGWPGPARTHPDFVPCFVANTVLGVFGMYGRLGKSVRSTNGLAYYAYSKVDGGKGPGPWRVVAGVNPANVDRALELVLTELRTLREAPVPEEELNDSRSYLTGSLPLRLETNEGVAQALINIERYDLGMDYLQQYAEMIAGVTPDQVQAVAQRWIDPEHYALAIAEPAPEVTT